MHTSSTWKDIASGSDRHLDLYFGMQVFEKSSLVTVLIREEPFIHLFFFFSSGVLFLLIDSILITYLLYIGGQGRIKIASASTS